MYMVTSNTDLFISYSDVVINDTVAVAYTTPSPGRAIGTFLQAPLVIATDFTVVAPVSADNASSNGFERNSWISAPSAGSSVFHEDAMVRWCGAIESVSNVSFLEELGDSAARSSSRCLFEGMMIA